jgi:hypothetical protein
VLKILEAQLIATRSKLGELHDFERDLESNIKRMQSLIDEARKHR